jgi:hypothetical protein
MVCVLLKGPFVDIFPSPCDLGVLPLNLRIYRLFQPPVTYISLDLCTFLDFYRVMHTLAADPFSVGFKRDFPLDFVRHLKAKQKKYGT